MDGHGELTTAQVADYLGVKPQTIYAYVSRGVLSPLRREPGTGSLFRLEDVQGLVGSGRSGRRRRATVSDDVRTTITQVTAGALAYRGRAIEDLAGVATYEQVRALLTGQEAQDGVPAPGEQETLQRLLAAVPDRATALDRCKHAVLIAAATDTGRYDRSPASVALAGRRAAWCMALTLPGARVAPGRSPTLAGTLAPALRPCSVGLLDTVLVLLADHDLAVSTTAVRVAISSGADAYSALVAGLAAADSPHHMRAGLAVLDWLPRALSTPQEVLDEALAGERPPPGFGHVVYTDQDPRARVLLELLAEELPSDHLAAIQLIEDELQARRGWVLTIDLALALLVRLHGLPRHTAPMLFACARTAGWAAHAIEELEELGMRFRLRGVYNGARHVTMGG